jgi:hypothetical protein
LPRVPPPPPSRRAPPPSPRRAEGRESFGDALELLEDVELPDAAPDLAIEVADAEVERVAGYGSPPSIPLTPLYAWRVFTRQRALREKLPQIAAQRARAEHDRDAELAELATELRPILESNEDHAALFEPLLNIERAGRERSRALAQTNSEYAAQLAAVDEERQSLERQLSEQRSAEQRDATVVTECERAHARVEARLKRLQIEIRAVVEQAHRIAGPGGKMPPEQQSKHDELVSQVELIKPELADLANELSRQRSELQAQRDYINQLSQNVIEVSTKKAAVDEEIRSQFVVAEGEGLAEAELRVLTLIGHQLFLRAKDLPVEADRLVPIVSADEAARALAEEHEKHLRALNAFDPATVQRGYIVAGGFALLLVLFVVLVVAL